MTIKQKKFVEGYIKTGHITKSAQKAGYSEKTAYSIGSENLKKPEIKEAINNRLLDLQGKTETSVEKIQLKHQNMQIIGLAKGDLATVTANIIGEGRTINAYSDTINNNNTDKPLDISAEDREQLKRLAQIQLSKSDKPCITIDLTKEIG
jgi:phage terminase small subunit